MKGLCINAENAAGITKGVKYPVKRARQADYVKVKNDSGKWETYSKSRFKAIIYEP